MRDNKIKSIFSRQFLLRNAALWTAKGVDNGVDIAVRDGMVARIGRSLCGAEFDGFLEVNAKGFVVLPAGVDAQVHLRVPGQPQKETASSGVWAAVAGGVGALLTMPNTKPVLDNLETLSQAKSEVRGPEQETGVKVLFSAAMTIGQKGHDCVDFQKLAEAGVSAFTDDGVGVASDNVMLKVIKGASKTGLPILQHAEVPGHGAVLATGPIQDAVGGPVYPESAEVDMVKRDLLLLRDVPQARYHVLHVSSAETIRIIRDARKSGLKVTCEVSPHHLFFNSKNIRADNSSFKMNPPLRSAADQSALQAALTTGDCDFMATDHAPHEPEVKTTNFKTSAFGTTGLETSLRVLIWLWQQGRLTEGRLVDVWATSPAKFLGIYPDYGDISEGRPFNAVVCDVNAPEQLVKDQDFVGQSRNSCFIGSLLPGKIIMTILRDKIHHIT